MTYKEIYETSLSEKKRKEEKYKLYERFIGRPISILMTMPLLDTKITPTFITKLSVLSSVIGFAIISLSNSLQLSMLGWFFFFLWGELDGVDGNIARCKNQCSLSGELWDALGGYAAMALIYFSAGILAYHDANVVDFVEKYWYIVMGGLSALVSIFPRLMMHKKKGMVKETSSIDAISNSQTFGLSQIALLNLTAPSGGLQIIYLISIIFHGVNIFIAFYLIINMAIMIVSLYKLFK